MTTAFSQLQGEQYISLKTFRKSGQAVPSPVWFAQEGDTLYVVTQADSWKVKRIRNNGEVEVAPSDVRGNLKGADYTPAHARIIPADGSEEAKRALRALQRKYNVQLLLFQVMWRFSRKPHTFLAITPR